MIDYTQHQADPFLLANAEVIVDYSEFSGEDRFDIAVKVSNARQIIKEDFERLGDKFYIESQSYIYDNIAANPTAGIRANLINTFIPHGIRNLRDHPGKTFADFGGGVGVGCQLACALGKNTTYIDLKSHSSDFAEWRNNKHNFGYTMVIIDENDFVLPQAYDLLYTDAVWEHIPPEKQITYAAKLASYLNIGGMMYFLVDLSGKNDAMPMHFDVDIKEVHNTLITNGLTCSHGINTFASVWHK